MPSIGSVGLGLTDMPSSHSHRVPFFNNQSGDLFKTFLCKFKELADTHHLVEEERVQTIICYILLELQDLWQLLDGFAWRDWPQLKCKLKEIYGDTSAHYSKKPPVPKESTMHAQMAEEVDIQQYYFKCECQVRYPTSKPV